MPCQHRNMNVPHRRLVPHLLGEMAFTRAGCSNSSRPSNTTTTTRTNGHFNSTTWLTYSEPRLCNPHREVTEASHLHDDLWTTHVKCHTDKVRRNHNDSTPPVSQSEDIYHRSRDRRLIETSPARRCRPCGRTLASSGSEVRHLYGKACRSLLEDLHMAYF